MSKEFTEPIREFVDNNCSTFVNKDENKLEHTILHNKFKDAIETSLEFMLIEVGCSHEQFVNIAEIGLNNPEEKKYFEKIIACDNFLYFKSMMVQRNVQLQEQTYRLMSAAENNQTQNSLTDDEAYNTLLRIKENTEYECAISMSLAVSDERSKLGMKDVNEEDELLVNYF